MGPALSFLRVRAGSLFLFHISLSAAFEYFDKISKVLKKITLFFIEIFSEMWYYEL